MSLRKPTRARHVQSRDRCAYAPVKGVGGELREMVEAAGVEPASEKARHETTTCVSGSWFSSAGRRTGEVASRLARLISTYGYERKPSAQTAI